MLYVRIGVAIIAGYRRTKEVQHDVFPLAPEPIFKQDGQKQNDCKRHAAKRLLTATRREHPDLTLLVVEDALASNAPHIEDLKPLNYRFILRIVFKLKPQPIVIDTS